MIKINIGFFKDSKMIELYTQVDLVENELMIQIIEGAVGFMSNSVYDKLDHGMYFAWEPASPEDYDKLNRILNY